MGLSKSFVKWAVAGGLFMSLAVAPAVQAAWDLSQQAGMNEIGSQVYSNSPTDPRDVVVTVIKVFFGFLALIFVIYIIVAGYKWMTAAGNEKMVEEAKKTITHAVVGLLIIFVSYSIVYFVTKTLLDRINTP